MLMSIFQLIQFCWIFYYMRYTFVFMKFIVEKFRNWKYTFISILLIYVHFKRKYIIDIFELLQIY